MQGYWGQVDYPQGLLLSWRFAEHKAFCGYSVKIWETFRHGSESPLPRKVPGIFIIASSILCFGQLNTVSQSCHVYSYFHIFVPSVPRPPTPTSTFLCANLILTHFKRHSHRSIPFLSRSHPRKWHPSPRTYCLDHISIILWHLLYCCLILWFIFFACIPYGQCAGYAACPSRTILYPSHPVLHTGMLSFMDCSLVLGWV